MTSLNLIYSDDLVSIIVDSLQDHLYRNHKNHLLHGPIIDLGCGTGAFLHELKRRNPSTHVIGVDQHPQERYKDVSYLTSDLTRTNLSSSSASLIITLNISDYIGITISQESFFQEVDRLLMPNGVYVPLDLFRKKLIAPFQNAQYKSFALDYQEKPSHNIL